MLTSRRVLESIPAAAHGSIVDLLRWRATATPERRAFAEVSDRSDVTWWTYAALDARARAIAATIQARGAAGERVLLALPWGLDYVAAFFGCLYANAVAVPAYPPQGARHIESLRAIVGAASPALAIARGADSEALAPQLEHPSNAQRCDQLDVDTMASERPADWQPTPPDPSALAFLQFTSGSTAAPKGVMVEHGNLLASQSMIHEAFGTRESDVIVGWLPLHHDMGLIGNVLHPIYLGATGILLAPATVIRRPAAWLDAMSSFQATVSGGPNFAYELCVERIAEGERKGLDLHRWRVAFNGAERVRARTLERFASAFGACGFRREAFRPCYGLAEATLLVTAAGGASGERAARSHGATADDDRDAPVGCGRAPTRSVVAIVDPESARLRGPGEAGEIWVAGPHVARGYWGRPEATAQTFGARIADDIAGRPYLRTGDLGFLDGEELVVTGRLKDTIVVHGANHHAEDLEWTAQKCHGALSRAAVAAFSIDSGSSEDVVIVVEALGRELEWPAIAERLREAIAAAHEIQLSAVVVVERGGVVMTTSGKVRRSACREAYTAGRIVPVYEWRRALSDASRSTAVVGATPGRSGRDVSDQPPPNPICHAVVTWLAARLGVAASTIDVEAPLVRFGMDSIAAIEIAHHLEQTLDVAVGPEVLLGTTPIRRLVEAAVPCGRHTNAAVADVETWPASIGQQALWMLWRAAPLSGAYNIAAAATAYELNRTALRTAFERVLEAHPALRSSFAVADDVVVQRTYREIGEPFGERDASAWDEATLRAELGREADRPFDLEQPPLVRMVVFARTDGDVVLLVLHHIIGDARSLTILLQDLGRYYDAVRARIDARVESPRSGYSVFAAWQRAMVAGSAGERSWEYWRNELRDAAPLRLATDERRPSARGYRGAVERREIDAARTARLRALAAAEDVTLYVVVLAMQCLLFHRETGSDDLLIGMPVAGRPAAEFDGVIGYFANTVPLRVRMNGAETFGDVVGRVRDAVLGAIAHQHYPFALIAQRMRPLRQEGESPLFGIVSVFEQAAAPFESLAAFPVSADGVRTVAGSLVLQSRAIDRRSSQFDLTLACAEIEGALHVCATYDSELFAAATMARLLERFDALVQAVAEQGGGRLEGLPSMSAAEHDRVVIEWNRTARSYPFEPVHLTFERRATETPAAVAVRVFNERLTYADVNQRANAVAQRLLESGLTRGSRVGVYLERGPHLLPALLGVLKAGAAYLPLEPEQPASRIAHMLAGAGVQVVLTDDTLVSRLGDVDATVYCVGGEHAADAPPLRGGPIDADDLAYVIYTSGSTGGPKGVMSTHGGLCNRLRWMQEAFPLGADDRVFQKTPIGFDVSVWELFWPLMTGATIVLARPGGHREPHYLARTIADERITTVHFVPSMLQAFLDAEGLERCTELRRIICSGEALAAAVQQRCLERLDSELHNLYGPTEASIDVTWWRCRSDEDRAIPIGRPIANTTTYVLDRHGRPVATGSAGELFLGGVGLARGYVNQPGLTAARFVPDPFDPEPGRRLYRTGDIARYRPDGNIEFLGRRDAQVKIRGQRVELGEIEEAILQFGGITAAAVLLVGEGDPRLVAYIGTTAATSTTDLRVFLGAQLPAYMVPAVFVLLPQLPRTSSGKIDRRALPAADQTRPDLESVFEPPTTPLQQVIASVWARALGLSAIGIHDNFFELGGHSLMAAQIAERLQAWYPTDSPMLALLLQNPTVAGLADGIAECPMAQEAIAATASLAANIAGSDDEAVVT